MKIATFARLLTLLLTVSLVGCSDDETCQSDADCSGRGPNFQCDSSTSSCVCVPACDGLDCGPDGCGSACPPGCTSETQCEHGVCVCRPNCNFKDCGDDGCGVSCGSCTGVSDACDATGVCIDITKDAALNPCQDALPVCNTTAACAPEPTDYLEGDFPGTRSFVVRSDGTQWIGLLFVFKDRVDTGTATQVLWYEPDCVGYNILVEDGSALFTDYPFLAESGPIGEGAHLIEISSDATAHYYLRALAH